MGFSYGFVALAYEDAGVHMAKPPPVQVPKKPVFKKVQRYRRKDRE